MNRTEEIERLSAKLIQELIEINYQKGRKSIINELRQGNTVHLHSIISNNMEKAKEYVDKLIGNKIVVSSKNNSNEHEYACIYDVYRIYRANENIRGNRCHYLHIDSDIDNATLIDQVFKPTCTLLRNRTIDAITYF